jgi:hypothetical protein
MALEQHALIIGQTAPRENSPDEEKLVKVEVHDVPERGKAQGFDECERELQ